MRKGLSAQDLAGMLMQAGRIALAISRLFRPGRCRALPRGHGSAAIHASHRRTVDPRWQPGGRCLRQSRTMPGTFRLRAKPPCRTGRTQWVGVGSEILIHAFWVLSLVTRDGWEPRIRGRPGRDSRVAQAQCRGMAGSSAMPSIGKRTSNIISDGRASRKVPWRLEGIRDSVAAFCSRAD